LKKKYQNQKKAAKHNNGSIREKRWERLKFEIGQEIGLHGSENNKKN
jgi:hypothetical protein